MRQRSHRAALFGGALAAAIGAVVLAGAALVYPPAPRGKVVDDYHGTLVADPYRWLEDLDSPATRAWVQAEAQLTQSYLSATPLRGRLARRIAALYDYQAVGVPFEEGGRYFYTFNSGHQDQAVLFITADLAARGSPGVDPNTLTPEGIVTGYVASRDGRLLAYGVSVGGSDWAEWRIRDLASGKDLPDVLRFTKYYEPAFTRDGKGLYYSAFPAPQPGAELSTRDLDDAIYYHALGTPVAADARVLYDAGHPDWQYEPHISDDGRWLTVTSGEGEVGDKGLENVYLLDLDATAPAAAALVQGFEAAYNYVGSDAGRLYFLTTLDAPNGRVIAIDPTAPQRANWRTTIPEGADAIDLTTPSVTLVDHQLIVRTIHDAHSRVLRYGLDGTPRGEIVLPGPGTAAGFHGRSGDRETFYSFRDLITPPTVYRYDLEQGRSTRWRPPHVAFDPGAFGEEQVFYPAKDGTHIPMLLAYRKGLKLDGDNPLLLYGYGGFGIPNLPRFDAALIAWLEMGGVYAVANIRGGGEYGEAWHRQAIRTHRQVAFDDFIAAGEWLIAKGYTSVPRLAIYGASNGGLLVGACMTQRPDLYGAVIADVGVMDMLRFPKFGQGAGWEGDFGSPDNPEEFKALYAYSPLHSVRAGVHFPATLVITGDHDTRVFPGHSFKFAAALQWAQAGEAPELLDVELNSGHGGSQTLFRAIGLHADIYAFLARNLAMQSR
ncbi:MAG TPA: prolyl oligopeptidase family serine peptidase [Steroidobacteraceae bacterium]|nr:prolyl oligopeptidase family serine peptidase [Steroidobacteraceae bacterium]